MVAYVLSGDAQHNPWPGLYDVRPFNTVKDTWYSDTASLGFIIRHDGWFLQYISGSVCNVQAGAGRGEDISTLKPGSVRRTLGIARTLDLNGRWEIIPQPLVSLDHQIENSSLYYEETNKTWFLFTNHVGIGVGETGQSQEFTDAIWVYWSKDPLRWNAENRAIVLDDGSCTWSNRCIGMPAVIPYHGRLAVRYDAAGGESISHMRRNIGLAWLNLPLTVPE